MGVMTLALTWNGPEFESYLSPILTLNLKINLLKPSLFYMLVGIIMGIIMLTSWGLCED